MTRLTFSVEREVAPDSLGEYNAAATDELVSVLREQLSEFGMAPERDAEIEVTTFRRVESPRGPSWVPADWSGLRRSNLLKVVATIAVQQK